MLWSGSSGPQLSLGLGTLLEAPSVAGLDDLLVPFLPFLRGFVVAEDDVAARGRLDVAARNAAIISLAYCT